MADLYPGAVAQQVGGYFPRSGVEPQLVVSVVHITAGLGDALAIAKSVEAKQVTASFWTNRDGRIYQTMLDPAKMGPWTNGVLNAPDLSNARIARMKADGVNPNKRSLLTIENAGLEPGSPITAAQERACANIIGHYHRKYGVPITRETVVGHYQFDSVNRRNCPSTNKAILDRIVALANGGAEPMITILSFPDGAFHTVNIPPGATVDGWTATAKVKSQAWPNGSSFPADCRVKIDQPNAPKGTFWHCTAGVYAGLYVPEQQATDGGPIASDGDTDAAYNEGLAAAQAAVEALPDR